MPQHRHKITWMEEPEPHDFDAAESFLSLIMDPADAATARQHLMSASIRTLALHPAKDLLRAAGLPLLPEGNKHVAGDLAKIMAGKPLSPVLAMRGMFSPLVIADGSHRACAVYWTDENELIPVVLA